MKKQLFKITLSVAVLFAASVAFVACSDSTRNARLEVYLTDAPGDYDEVNVDIQGVQVHTETGDQNSGWKSLDVNTGVYNLLKLTNGLDTLLGATELPAGKISQIRLILGNNNSLLIGEDMHDLKTPSSQQSGLKLNVNAVLVEGLTYRITLDFDAAKSVVATGAGTYNLKPVIRAISTATSGAIDGTVSIPESKPAVFAVLNGDTVETAYADSVTGNFLLRALDEGSYHVLFSPAEGYAIDSLVDVPVMIGVVTHLGVVEVTQ